MGQELDIDALGSFVPRLARQGAVEVPFAWELSGAVLLVDVSGFSKYAHLLAETGERSAERLQRLLNSVCSPIAEIATARGGDVVGFAGDASIVCWPSDAARSIEGAVREAKFCAQELLQATDQNEFRLRAAIGAGTIWCATVGTDNTRLLLVAGTALEDAAHVAKQARLGKLTLSARAERLLTQRIAIRSPRSHQGAKSRPGSLGTYISIPLKARLRTGDRTWVSEFRQSTVMFIGFGPLEAVPSPNLGRLQTRVETILAALGHYGGALVQSIVDDINELVFVTAWGTAESCHENNASRALDAALHITANHADASVGVATGRVFCGLRGSTDRSEYALVANEVNLAARLMCAARQANQHKLRVLCDRATADAAESFTLQLVGSMKLKGMGATEIYRPIPGSHIGGKRRTLLPLLGREEELKWMQQHLSSFITKDPNSLRQTRGIWVEGEPGIGKSRLLGELHPRPLAQTAVVRSDPLDAEVPFLAFRSLLGQLLPFQEMRSDIEKLDYLTMVLRGSTRFANHGSLLGALVDLDIACTDAVAQLAPRAQVDATEHLIVELLARLGSERTVVIVADDVQWLDSPSWSVCRAAIENVPGVFFVFASRPMRAKTVPQARVAALCERRQLDPLAPSAAIAMAKAQLGVTELPKSVRDMLKERSGGNPFYVQELVLALRASGAIFVEGQRCLLRHESLGQVPRRVEDLIVSRVDRLPADVNMTLRVASVLGRAFHPAALAAIHPVERDRTTIDLHLGELSEQELLEMQEMETTFRHSLTRDAVYGLLPQSQLRMLHSAAAAYFESELARDPALVTTIADHYARARMRRTAMEWLERASVWAYNRTLYHESVALYRSLLDAATASFDQEWDGAPLEATDRSLVRWEVGLGTAAYDAGKLPLARERLEHALLLLGYPVVTSRWQLAWRIPWLLLVIAARVGLGLKRTPTPNELDASTALVVLTRILHLAQEPAVVIYHLLQRRAYLVGSAPSRELLIDLGGFAYVQAAMGFTARSAKTIEMLGEVHQVVQDDSAYAQALYPVTIMRLGQGQWEECRREALFASHVFTSTGDRQLSLSEDAVLANLYEMIGDFRASHRYYSSIYARAKIGRDELALIWGAGGLAMLALRFGDYAAAERFAEESLRVSREKNEAVSELSSLGCLALSAWRRGDRARFLVQVKPALAVLSSSPRVATAHHYLNGFNTLTEAFLLWWDGARRAGRRGEARAARRACGLSLGRFRSYASRFPIGKPLAAVWQGVQLIQLERRRGLEFIDRGIRHAQDLRMPYDEAQGWLELGRHLPASERRQEALKHAEAIFRSLEAAGDVARCRVVANASIPSPVGLGRPLSPMSR